MDSASLLPVVALLALAVAVVIVLLRLMRARHAAHDFRAQAERKPEPRAQAPLSKEEADYLDSSHISGPVVPGTRDALDGWQSNKRK